MMTTSIRTYKIKKLLQAKNLINGDLIPKQCYCLCGHVYLKPETINFNTFKREHTESFNLKGFKRVYSTQTDHDRQKTVILKPEDLNLSTFKRLYSTQNDPKSFNLSTFKREQTESINLKAFKRVYSTQSDQHRQKVVMETSTPNVIHKLGYEKDEKLWNSIYPYLRLARWDKPIGIYLLFWPCSWSIAMATITTGVDLSTAFTTAGLFLVGAGLMRGAGCTINDMWDKDIDKQVDRTANRPLVTGQVTTRGAVTFLALQLSAALAVLLQLNCYSVALGASSLALVITYPLAKRFTNYPQLFLGATFNWGALLGFSAITGTIDPYICLPLYIGALAWTVVYDTIYAHQDKHDDARIGMKSTALTFGPRTKPLLTGWLAVSAAGLAGAGVGAELGPAFAVAGAVAAARQVHQIYTLDIDNPTDCAEKFFSNSYIGLIILIGILGGGYNTYLENRRKNANKNTSDVTRSCVFG